MKVQTDAYMSKGHAHTVCEDYALHGTSVFPYFMLADGCSSSPHSEVAAQLLCWSAARQLHCMANEDVAFSTRLANYRDAVLEHAQQAAKAIAYPGPLLATLMVGYVVGGYAHVLVWGDGVITTLDRQGNRVAEIIQFRGNAPHYMAYENRLMQGAEKTVTRLVLNRTQCDQVQQVPAHVPICRCYDVRDYIFIGIMSDGVESVMQRQTHVRMVAKSVLSAFLAFKNFRGEFIQRRCKRVMSEWVQSDHVPMDDLTYAGVSFLPTLAVANPVGAA